MAADTRGVFTLKTVRNNILNDEGVSLQDVFIEEPDESQTNIEGDTQGPNTGYVVGGNG